MSYSLNRVNRGFNRNADISLLEANVKYECLIKDRHWLVKFFSDGKPMRIPATYHNIDTDLFTRAHVKVGDTVRVKLGERDRRWEEGTVEVIGSKAQVEYCLHQMSQGQYCQSAAANEEVQDPVVRERIVTEADLDAISAIPNSPLDSLLSQGVSSAPAAQREPSPSTLQRKNSRKRQLNPSDIENVQPKVSSCDAHSEILDVAKELKGVVVELKCTVKEMNVQMTATMKALGRNVNQMVEKNAREAEKFAKALNTTSLAIQRISTLVPGAAANTPCTSTGKQPILNPFTGKNLLEIEAPSVEKFTRLCGSTLWSKQDIQTHMLSPDLTKKNHRPEFSPRRKKMLKDAVMTKYDKNPDLAWARGKVSFNKKGPEITNREKNVNTPATRTPTQVEINITPCGLGEAFPENVNRNLAFDASPMVPNDRARDLPIDEDEEEYLITLLRPKLQQ